MNVVKRRSFDVRGFAPGETVAVTGVYRVVHAQHRADHEVVAINGDILPTCRVCQSKVRFYVERAMNYAAHDWDLAGPIAINKAASK